VDSLVLSLRTMFDPRAAKRLRASYELRFGEDRFRAVVDDGWFEISRGSADHPDTIVEADSGTLAALVYAGGSLAEALESEDLKIEGDRSAFGRFLKLFPLPEPAPPAGT
jgi:alkyl sulfatase BDS1-like metallo-beta-lactamase superfamily hydrolase